jgi:hypothetical protein
MNNYLLLMRWLVVVGVVDWLLARTVTRVAIFVPMPPALAGVFRLLDSAGQVAISLAGLLVFVVLGLLVREEWRQRWGLCLAPALAGLIALSLLFLVVPPAGWLALAGHFLYLALIALLVVRAAPQRGEGAHLSMTEWVALLLPALAIVAGRLHQALPALYATLHWPGPAPLTTPFFNLGELLIVSGAFALWWAYGRDAARWAWFIAAVPTLAFAALYMANAHMIGILTIWSTGLTLYLPWPLYAAAIWLAGITLVAPRAHTRGIGWAILLLAAGGYAPQLSAQAFLSLIAIYLLTGTIRQQRIKETPELHPNLLFAKAVFPSTNCSVVTCSPPDFYSMVDDQDADRAAFTTLVEC